MNEPDNQNIYVSGIGVVSAFGDTFEEFIEGINSGKSMFTYMEDEHIIKDKQIPVIKASIQSEVQNPEDRILALGYKAICSALDDRNADCLPDIHRICLIAGSGMGLIDQYYYVTSKYDDLGYFCSLAEKLSEKTGLNCEAVYIGNACSSGSQAISYGMDLLKSGRYDLVIAGGIDILSQTAYSGFLRLNAIDLGGCKPFDQNRKGIAIGEGAVFYVLERRSKTEDSTKAYCILTGSGVTSDAYHIVQMKPDGKEIMRAMDQALSLSNISKFDVDLIVAHGTGTIQNDKIEAQIINQYFGEHSSDIYVTTPKGTIGHTGGASGAFGLLVAISAFRTGIISPICNLEEQDHECNVTLVSKHGIHHKTNVAMINAFAFGGTNVVILCKKEEESVI